MRSRISLFVFTCCLLGGLIAQPASAADSKPFDGQPEQIQLRVQPTPDAAPAEPDYVSGITRTGEPFTHLLLRREAKVPSGGALSMQIRVSADGESWTDWGQAPDDPDLWVPSDGPNVAWSDTIAVGAVAQFWQVRAFYTSAPDGAAPALSKIDVNTVDTRLSPQQSAVQSEAFARAGQSRASGISKPAVVSRSAWGSPDGQSSRATPAYYAVNHMVVHHTADSSTLTGKEQSWADRVRAEWTFHTITRGWGDVGYNYLIDPNGVIYEGRAGGDDAVGFHDTANYGSMGVSVIGTYTSSAPSTAAQQSLVSLLAWKASQKKIDPLGSSFYYGCSISAYCKPVTGTSVIANIAGHRQVTPGHTTCPGDAFMAILPSIRQQVQNRLSGQGDTATDNGDLQVDEVESSFTSVGDWHTAACGEGGSTQWTYATDAQAESTNMGTWKPNIPKAGTYRVYVSIPQGCGIASPPYATGKASYTIHVKSGEEYTRVVDQNTADQWVDLGAYDFGAGQGGWVVLSDMAEPFAQQKVIFFDSVKWVAEDTANTNPSLVSVSLTGPDASKPGQVPSGGLLKVSFTIKNSGSTTLSTQEPQATLSPDGARYNDASSGTDDSYVYDEGECFIGDSTGSYGAFPKESSSFRLALGPKNLADVSLSCAGAVGSDATGYYPWRWGLNGPLAPGETRTVTGYIRMRNPGTTSRTITLQAGLVQEYVKYYATSVAATSITVTPEQSAPALAELGGDGAARAQVYRMASIPANFLARTSNPLSIATGEQLGSFAWNGAPTDWGTGGPVSGATDSFVVQQTRAFSAPTAGEYTFRTTSDDGSWLWVDGQLVVNNYGLHDSENIVDGKITLSAGVHTLGFKYFERSGGAAAGYTMARPGSEVFELIPDATAGGALALGGTFVQTPSIALAAEDLGGLGVAKLSYRLNGGPWVDSTDRLAKLGSLANGSYTLSYAATDAAGNSAERSISFVVDSTKPYYRTYVPAVMR